MMFLHGHEPTRRNHQIGPGVFQTAIRITDVQVSIIIEGSEKEREYATGDLHVAVIELERWRSVLS